MCDAVMSVANATYARVDTLEDDDEQILRPVNYPEAQPSVFCSLCGVDITARPRGEVTMLLCTLIYGLQSLLAKRIEDDITALELVTYRSVLAGSISLSVLLRAPAEDQSLDERLFGTRELRTLVMLRGSVGAAAFISLYSALHYIALGEHTALLFLNPIWISVFAWPILGERPTAAVAFAVALGAVGAILVTQPRWLVARDPVGNTAEHVRGVAIAIVGSVLVAATMLIVRTIGPRVSSLKLALSFHLFSSMLGANALALGLQQPQVPSKLKDITLLLLISATSFVGQPLMSYSFQHLPAARAASLNYLQLLWAFILGAIAYHERPSWLQIAGALLLNVSGVCVALSKKQDNEATVDLKKTLPASADSDTRTASSEEAARRRWRCVDCDWSIFRKLSGSR